MGLNGSVKAKPWSLSKANLGVWSKEHFLLVVGLFDRTGQGWPLVERTMGGRPYIRENGDGQWATLKKVKGKEAHL